MIALWMNIGTLAEPRWVECEAVEGITKRLQLAVNLLNESVAIVRELAGVEMPGATIFHAKWDEDGAVTNSTYPNPLLPLWLRAQQWVAGADGQPKRGDLAEL